MNSNVLIIQKYDSPVRFTDIWENFVTDFFTGKCECSTTRFSLKVEYELLTTWHAKMGYHDKFRTLVFHSDEDLTAFVLRFGY